MATAEYDRVTSRDTPTFVTANSGPTFVEIEGERLDCAYFPSQLAMSLAGFFPL